MTTKMPPRHTAAGSDESLRADARRNRARVLAAAEAVFAAKGASASTSEVARAAGVGIGTVFRHFPTKEALLEAIIIARMQRMASEADGLANADDAGAAFFSFFEHMVEHAATKKIFTDALAVTGVDVKSLVAPIAAELRRAIGMLVARAQAAGAVRADTCADEVIALMMGASRATEYVAGDPGTHGRALAIIFDGLRPRS